jgi:iron uptake system EfeUOB component EfeO/EfeM
MYEPDEYPIKPPLQQTAVSGSLTHIPLFQYEAAVEAHKNTLDLLRIIQVDKKELKEELEAAYREIDRLNGILNYR